jgi:hypothetical protein
MGAQPLKTLSRGLTTVQPSPLVDGLSATRTEVGDPIPPVPIVRVARHPGASRCQLLEEVIAMVHV